MSPETLAEAVVAGLLRGLVLALLVVPLLLIAWLLAGGLEPDPAAAEVWVEFAEPAARQ